MRSDDEIRADLVRRNDRYGIFPADGAQRALCNVPDLLAEVVRLRAAVDAVTKLHAGWHVCVNADGRGAQDWCDDEDGMRPCPTVAALAGAEQEAGTG